MLKGLGSDIGVHPPRTSGRTGWGVTQRFDSDPSLLLNRVRDIVQSCRPGLQTNGTTSREGEGGKPKTNKMVAGGFL